MNSLEKNERIIENKKTIAKQKLIKKQKTIEKPEVVEKQKTIKNDTIDIKQSINARIDLRQKKTINMKRFESILRSKNIDSMIDILQNYMINDKEIEQIRRKTNDYRVYKAIAEHELTNGKTLKKLLMVDYVKQRNDNIANIIRENTDELMKKNIKIKQLVAGHQNTNINILKKLTRYPDSTVASIAKSNLIAKKKKKAVLINNINRVNSRNKIAQNSIEIEK